MKKRIKWYNIIYLVFNVYVFTLMFRVINHLNEIQRDEITMLRLSWITIICFIVIVMASALLRKAYSLRKEN